MRLHWSFSLTIYVVECIHSELEAVSTIQNVYTINVGPKWSIYIGAVYVVLNLSLIYFEA
jgi:hypothetical protein